MNAFITSDRPLNTCMVQERELSLIYERIRQGIQRGADAFGLQFEVLASKDFTDENLRSLFAACDGRPAYVTYYRNHENEGKTDEELAQGLKKLARCGAALVDVIGDMFGRDRYQIDCGTDAIARQRELIDELHALGSAVLMSSHVMEFRDSENVLAIAREQISRGADVSKIVTAANSPEEEQRNLYTTSLLKKELGHPFLFLSGGTHNRLHRRLGGMLGCRMWLTVAEHDEFATPAQPLTGDVDALRKLIEEGGTQE